MFPSDCTHGNWDKEAQPSPESSRDGALDGYFNTKALSGKVDEMREDIGHQEAGDDHEYPADDWGILHVYIGNLGPVIAKYFRRVPDRSNYHVGNYGCQDSKIVYGDIHNENGINIISYIIG